MSAWLALVSHFDLTDLAELHFLSPGKPHTIYCRSIAWVSLVNYSYWQSSIIGIFVKLWIKHYLAETAPKMNSLVI